MKKRTRANAKDLTWTLLKIIGMGSGCAILYGLRHGRSGDIIWRELERYTDTQIKAVLARMRLRKFVRVDESDKRNSIVVTSKGLRRLSLQEKRPKLFVEREWDFLWRMLVFDISNGTARNAFRRDITSLGWERLQQSVYVHPSGNVKETKACIDFRRLGRRCVIVTAASLGPFENTIRRRFFGKAAE